MRRICIVLGLALSSTGCDDGKSEDAAPESKAEVDAKGAAQGKAAVDADASPADDTSAKTRKSRRDRGGDRGSLSMMVAGKPWTTERASASIRENDKGTKLRISASISTHDGPNIHRQQLTLTLDDYDGPGTYTTRMIDSHFTGVGVNTDDVKEAEDAKDSDAKTSKVAMDAIKGGKVTLMPNAKVEVTTVSDDFIDGTFEWKANGGHLGPTMTEGKFHAKIRKKKK